MAETSIGRRRSSKADTSALGSDRSRLNQVLMWALIVLLALSPIPFGSTTPMAWIVWAGLVSAICIVYVSLLGSAGRKASLGLLNLGAAPVLHCIFCLYLIVQILPLGQFFGGFPVTLSDGSVIRMATISIAPGDTLMMLMRMLTYAMLFYLTAQVAISDKRRQMLMRAIVVIVVAHGLYGLVALFQLGDTLLGAPKWKYFGSATGTFLNRNNYSTYLIFGMACAATMAASSLLRKRGETVRVKIDSVAILNLVAVVILMSVITVTNSRMGFALGWGALALTVFLLVSRNLTLVRPALLALPVMLIGTALLIFVYGQDLWDRYESSEQGLTNRLDIYGQAAKLISERPLTGFGGGTFGQAFPVVHTAALDPHLYWDKAHDTYITLWSEFGLIAGSIPMLTIALLAGMILINLFKGLGSWTAQAAALVVIVIGAVHSLVDFSLEIQAVAILFVVICAIGLSGSKVKAPDH